MFFDVIAFAHTRRGAVIVPLFLSYTLYTFTFFVLKHILMDSYYLWRTNE